MDGELVRVDRELFCWWSWYVLDKYGIVILTIVQSTGHRMAKYFKLPAGLWTALPTVSLPLRKPKRYIYLSLRPKTSETASVYYGGLHSGVHLTSHNFRSTLRAVTSWLDDPAWMRVSSTLLIYVQSSETSGAGTYSSRCGHVTTLLKGQGRLFHLRLQFSITTTPFCGPGYRMRQSLPCQRLLRERRVR
jgi:hypothetical protein